MYETIPLGRTIVGVVSVVEGYAPDTRAVRCAVVLELDDGSVAIVRQGTVKRARHDQPRVGHKLGSSKATWTRWIECDTDFTRVSPVAGCDCLRQPSSSMHRGRFSRMPDPRRSAHRWIEALEPRRWAPRRTISQSGWPGFDPGCRPPSDDLVEVPDIMRALEPSLADHVTLRSVSLSRLDDQAFAPMRLSRSRPSPLCSSSAKRTPALLRSATTCVASSRRSSPSTSNAPSPT
jgi:hypothetical protein